MTRTGIFFTKKIGWIWLLGMLACGERTPESKTMVMEAQRPEFALVIHGGAGTILKEHMTPEKEAAYRAALDSALEAGRQVLERGGAAEDAVERAVRLMEDSPLFNAGRGAVFTHEGYNELDASMMSGADLSAGAVSGVMRVKNPISLARAVKDSSEHVMLSGRGAEAFAAKMGLELVEPFYFHTDERMRSLEKAKRLEGGSSFLSEDDAMIDEKFGTVGAVALDKSGNLAAATSTGGMTNKRWGRVGDSPIIGAGTYADNAACAVSCTGHGEYFIRLAVAARVANRMRFAGEELDRAARAVIMDELADMGGSGGLIAIDTAGKISMPFNTAGMYRGYVKGTEKYIAIYGEE